MDSQSPDQISQSTWLSELPATRTASFFDGLSNTPPAISDAGMQSMLYAHASPFSALPIRSVENSPAPGASPFSWSAFIVTGTPFLSPGGPDILPSRVEICPAGSPPASNPREPDIASAPSSPEQQTTVLPRTRITQSDWETHRPKIKKLYIDDNLSLKDTRQIMQEEYEFNAS
jgi:hypothetical protein